MIQLLATKYPKHIAYIFFFIFCCSIVPAYGSSVNRKNKVRLTTSSYYKKNSSKLRVNLPSFDSKNASTPIKKAQSEQKAKAVSATMLTSAKYIGGPNQPEMSSFKSVGSDNMVNLFTGDFSYNIPLLDVGGYPVNIFYDGNITMEQEASWVGLGWNINPGTVNRNMRGVPDDFNGDDMLVQTQNMKPNNTWGVSFGYDLELVGIKNLEGIISGSVGASLGVSFNNYLGPALDLGIKGGTNFKIASKTSSEKSAGIGAGLSANISSRNGLTLSPNVSLTANSFANVKGLSTGVRLGTSYNSRSGIKQLQISEQMSFNYGTAKNFTSHGQQMVRTNSESMSASLVSTSISFTKPSYVPTMRMPLTNEAYAGRFQLGNGLFGVYGSAEVEVYKQTSKVLSNDIVQKKPLVGYLYYQKANNNPNAVMDFTRFNDNEVTPNTPIISVAQYAYDVFSIQGEGTGGSIRAYRNDLGYVRDNTTRSQDKSLSAGVDIGIPGHFGANFNTVKTPTVIGEWENGNKLRNAGAAIGFKEANGTIENVYFRNPGETSVLHKDQFKKIGETDLVRFKLGGSDATPTIEPVLEQFSKANTLTGTTNMLAAVDPTERKKRTQVTNFLTAEEASEIGLDTLIKSYNATTVLDNQNNLQFESIPRVSNDRKKHHISQVNVTEASGKRYIYGLPVYNLIQKDFSFSVNNTETGTDQVAFDTNEPTTLKTDKEKDGFIQVTETPAYAHAFLLSGLLSPDYVDVSGNGITEDDLGDAVKFNYTQYAHHQWRTPLTSGSTPIANFNDGHRSERKDDKGLVSYGKRESWYLHSVESKTMMALFTLENREDGKGSDTELKGVNTSDNSLKRLKKIDLYSKADLKKNGLTKAKPIKTVWFTYSYTLCKGTPDNPSGNGKLTLDGIYFTFNGKNRVNKNKYAFYYTNQGAGNPNYTFSASDRWGNYKPAINNPSEVKNADYPYAVQNKSTADVNAGAWSLKRIVLPSGGEIEVTYESDDYAFVQNRRAAAMMEVAGFGNNTTAITNKLYSITGTGIIENDYAFIKVPTPCANKGEVFEKYLEGVNQLAFKVSVNMPKGVEYLNAYATIADYGIYDDTKIWLKLNKVNGLSPLSLTALEYLREQLPGQAFPGYNVESGGLKQVGEMLLGMLDALKSAFKDPIQHLRSQGKAQTIDPLRSFVRLNDPDGYKHGGGQRVKSVKLKDNWDRMTNQYASEYGQEYNYETTEMFNGKERSISSGVASYEPSIGSEENPFQTIVQIANKLPLGPASYGAIEMPVLDAFFPAPVVGYSKVTVKSLRKGDIDPTKKSRSGIGKQVTEFYTAKDFPVYYNHTSFDPSVDKQEHKASLLAFFYKYAFDSRALSQGFLVETNDMHGKLKSQASYAENDENTRINYTEHFYRNTGGKGLNEKFDFVYAAKGGVVEQGNMGIDIELMTDTREFSVKSTSLEIQGQVDLFPVIVPIWLPFIWPVSGNSENTYRAVTTTKVINYHSILDSIVVIDKGSMVSTKNLVYDAETGDVVVNRTNNEFDLSIYGVTYPAYWAYSGMGLAYKNIDAVYSNVNFRDGKIVSGNVPVSVLESGDELYLMDMGRTPTDNCGAKLVSSDERLLWAYDKNKNTSSLTNTTPDFVFMDKKGKLYTKDGVIFKIVRSGKRNMLSGSIAGVTTTSNPVATTGSVRKLVVDGSSKVINATAVEYKEKWQTDNDVFNKYSMVYNPATCSYEEQIDCNGYWEKSINPYRKGLMGNFRTWRNMVFYENRQEESPTTPTDISKNGFLKNFQLYWNFNTNNNLVPDVANAKWVWNSQLTKANARGLELETMNALNIYTSAQYGYNKTMPVAIANNARYDEMFYDGFEDYSYKETLNGASLNPCAQKHNDFSGLPNTAIVNTETTSFTAHSGKYVLAMNPNSISIRQLDVKSSIADSYPLTFTQERTRELFETGGNIHEEYPFPQHFNVVFQNNFGASLQSSGRTGQQSSIATSQYLEVKNTGIYTVSVSCYLPGNDYYHNASIAVDIRDLNGNSIALVGVGGTEPDSKDYRICLSKGIYIVGCYGVNTSSHPFSGGFDVTANLGYSINIPSLSYKSLSTQNGCTYTNPIAAKVEMQNSTFSIPANKQMVFSAWVREECGNSATGMPCNKSTFTDNKVILQFNDGSSTPTTLTPSGPIIDGWQRYEGYFTAPATATSATMRFENNSAQMIYFDDIRIHPFNANMKSYVYDPVNLRLTAELDANNYARFYEYDEEGTLIRTKVETKEGIKTINETRSFKQRVIK